MRRREFVSLLGGASVWPLTGHAQQRKVPRVSYLFSFTKPAGRLNLVIVALKVREEYHVR